MNIVQAINDDKLFKPVFRDPRTWGSWITLLKAFFGLPMSQKDLDLYRGCTGRQKPPEGEFKELWAICGRRGGKSFVASVVSCYLALFVDYSDYLSPGERGVVQIIAADRAQAGVILRYCKGILNSNPRFVHKEEIPMGLIGAIISGGLAGWLAGVIMKGKGQGLLMNIVIGFIGGFIGGFLFSLMGFTGDTNMIGSLVVATIGAIILLWIVNKIKS